MNYPPMPPSAFASSRLIQPSMEGIQPLSTDLPPSHLDLRKQRAKELFQQIKSNSSTDRYEVGDGTKYNRKRAWQAWNA